MSEKSPGDRFYSASLEQKLRAAQDSNRPGFDLSKLLPPAATRRPQDLGVPRTRVEAPDSMMVRLPDETTARRPVPLEKLSKAAPQAKHKPQSGRTTEEELDERRADIDRLKQQIRDIEAEASSTPPTIEKIAQRFAEMTTDITVINDHVTHLDRCVVDVMSQITVIETAVSVVQQSVVQADSRQQVLEKSVMPSAEYGPPTALESNLADALREMMEQQAAHHARLVLIEEQIKVLTIARKEFDEDEPVGKEHARPNRRGKP